MQNHVEVGPIRVKGGSRGFGFLYVATAADGGELGIPVHVIAGAKPGPKLVIMSSTHGYEYRQISVLHALYEQLDPENLAGTLIMIPVANPVSFEMGSRCTWIDALWGDSGNMNRLWPGRPNGWLTERFCYAISSQIIPGAAAVIDLHGHTPDLALSYGYLGSGKPGEVDYDISRVFGQEILVYNSPEEIAEKRQQGTSKSWLRSAGIPAYSCEIGEFYGLETERGTQGSGQGFRGVPEVGVTGVTNVMKYLAMIDGEIVRPTKQAVVQPELNLRPSHGGLVISNFGIKDLGRVLPKGTVLGKVVSPYSFAELEELTTPFEENLLLATLHRKPFSRVNPGDFGYIVADWSKTTWLSD